MGEDRAKISYRNPRRLMSHYHSVRREMMASYRDGPVVCCLLVRGKIFSSV